MGTDLISDSKRCHRHNVANRHNQLKTNGDPFEIFGHGIQSYFRVMEAFIKVFFVCSLLALGVMYMFYQGDTFNDVGGLDAILTPLTIGNLGHAETYCEHSYLAIKDKARYFCRKGKISNLQFFGLMPPRGDFENNFCGSFAKYDAITDCSTKYINQENLATGFAQECQGKLECKFEFLKYMNQATPTADKCIDGDSRFYV